MKLENIGTRMSQNFSILIQKKGIFYKNLENIFAKTFLFSFLPKEGNALFPFRLFRLSYGKVLIFFYFSFFLSNRI